MKKLIHYFIHEKLRNDPELYRKARFTVMPEQKEHLEKFPENWKNNGEQIDDILVIGIRL